MKSGEMLQGQPEEDRRGHPAPQGQAERAPGTVVHSVLSVDTPIFND